jgi:hypothetical protein
MCGSASDHNTYFATRNSSSLLWTSDKSYHPSPSESPERYTRFIISMILSHAYGARLQHLPERNMHVSESPHPSSRVAARRNFAAHVPSRNLQSFSSSGRHNYAYYFCTSWATACICSVPSALLQAALEDIVAIFDAGEMMNL